MGLCEYAGMRDRATFYAATSLTIYNVFESPKKVAQLDDGTKVTIEEALSQKQFKKIYIMLGINELGRGTTQSFFTVYADTVNRIRQLQPEAIIFVQGIMRVSGEKSRTDKVFNNAAINERNEALAAMANNQDIFYLEVNDAVCDANGDLVTEYTFDQIHLKAKYYQLWKNYLLGHGIVRDE
ncbi:MAG: GDSL-type esterase/lipase family protein [Eisenbergiella massiliensis]